MGCQVSEHLKEADRGLSQLIDRLIAMGSNVNNYAVLSADVSDHLLQARRVGNSSRKLTELKPVIEKIAARAWQVQKLLDSAAAFYLGYARAESQLSLYTHDGSPDKNLSAGAFRIQA